jgi:hypothetical protein
MRRVKSFVDGADPFFKKDTSQIQKSRRRARARWRARRRGGAGGRTSGGGRRAFRSTQDKGARVSLVDTTDWDDLAQRQEQSDLAPRQEQSDLAHQPLCSGFASGSTVRSLGVGGVAWRGEACASVGLSARRRPCGSSSTDGPALVRGSPPAVAPHTQAPNKKNPR